MEMAFLVEIESIYFVLTLSLPEEKA
jgi:hypothetical protein